MHLTDAGKIFFFVVIFFGFLSYWLAKRLVKRQLKTSKDTKITVAFWFLVIFCLNVFFYPFVYWLGKEIYVLSTYPSYQAQIVDFTAKLDTCEDSDGDSYDCWMYTPIFRFTLADGASIERPGNIRSGGKPTVGSSTTIVFDEANLSVHERSLHSIGLMIGAIIFLGIDGYFLLLATAYALGHNIEKLSRWGVLAAINGLIPLGTSFMMLAFLYVLYQYFLMGNPDDHPFWVVSLCLFFALALLPLLLFYLKSAIAAVFKGGSREPQ